MAMVDPWIDTGVRSHRAKNRALEHVRSLSSDDTHVATVRPNSLANHIDWSSLPLVDSVVQKATLVQQHLEVRDEARPRRTLGACKHSIATVCVHKHYNVVG
jgi:hypothetical protein